MATDVTKLRQSIARHLEKKQHERALEDLQRLVVLLPGDVRVLLQLAELQARMSLTQDALEAYGQAVEIYAREGFVLKATAVLKQMVKLDPNDRSLHEQLATHFATINLSQQALEHYDRVLSLTPASDVATRIRLYSAQIKLAPDSIAVRLALADALAQQGELPAAREQLEGAARRFRGEDRLEELTRVGERILRLDPSQFQLARELANIYLRLRQPKRALGKLRICFAMQPADIPTLTLLAAAFEMRDENARAVAVYRELMRLHQDTPRASQLFADRIRELSPESPRVAPSPQPFELEVTTSAPDEPQALADEIAFYVQQGLFTEAREVLEGALARFPESSQLLAWRARVLVEAPADFAYGLPESLDDEIDTMVGALDDLLAEKPAQAESVPDTASDSVHFDLGTAYLELNNFDDALAEFTRVAQNPERRIASLTMIGLCHMARGDAAAAILSYKAALSDPLLLAHERLAVYYELARAFEASGESRQALEWYRRVENTNSGFRNVRDKISDLVR